MEKKISHDWAARTGFLIKQNRKRIIKTKFFLIDSHRSLFYAPTPVYFEVVLRTMGTDDWGDITVALSNRGLKRFQLSDMRIAKPRAYVPLEGVQLPYPCRQCFDLQLQRNGIPYVIVIFGNNDDTLPYLYKFLSTYDTLFTNPIKLPQVASIKNEEEGDQATEQIKQDFERMDQRFSSLSEYLAQKDIPSEPIGLTSKLNDVAEKEVEKPMRVINPQGCDEEEKIGEDNGKSYPKDADSVEKSPEISPVSEIKEIFDPEIDEKLRKIFKIEGTFTKLARGSWYAGELKDGLPYKGCEVSLERRTIYTGEFLNGLPHGHGSVSTLNSLELQNDVEFIEGNLCGI
eukprot:TRINITY_DN10968_c0_g1_i2.p1 TRINITY_DN10968_c0_g1~~TRINITY_DN10968_c0_g1_i2.p1  ORF type:complete len:344 (-),score=43.58 TRINITY_DN10968_c0_g1_i2:17-1048(-)